MKIVKELMFYGILFMFLWILGSVWNVSNAQGVSTEEGKEIELVDLQVMRSQLIKESIVDEVSDTYNELKDKEFSDMVSIYEEEQRLIAEAKAKAEAEAKAKAEKEAKEKAEAEAKAKAEKEAKARAEKEAKAKAEKEAKERVNNKVSKSAESVKSSSVTIKQADKQQTINVSTTAYTAGCNGCSGITASGYNVRNTIYYQGMRIIAADTSILPMGTIVEVEGIGKAVVLDRGGAIKGHKIDILFGSKNEAYSYGRKHGVKVTVIGKL